MEERERYPDPTLLEMVRRSWLVLLLATALGGLAALAYVVLASPTYESSTTVLVGGRSPAPGSRAHDLMPTYSALVTSDALLDKTIAALDLPLTPAELRTHVRAEVDGNTRLLTIRAQDSGAARAVQIANQVARSLVAEGASRGETEAGSTDVQIEVVDRAGPRGARVKPNATFSLAAGLLAGAFAGLAFALRPRRRGRSGEQGGSAWPAGRPVRER